MSDQLINHEIDEDTEEFHMMVRFRQKENRLKSSEPGDTYRLRATLFVKPADVNIDENTILKMGSDMIDKGGKCVRNRNFCRILKLWT